MTRILIADDHAIVRRGLKQIIEESELSAEVAEAENARQLLQLIRKENWDLLVLDINMPGMSGLEALAEVKEKRPKLPVLVLSMYPEEQFAVRVLKAGAAGYLTKDSAPDNLMTAIRKVLSGGKYLSPSMADKLVADLQSPSGRPPHEALADREYQVLCLIGKGKTVSEIADELALSVKTISTYRTRILEKMNMKTNAELMQYAMRNRLVE